MADIIQKIKEEITLESVLKAALKTPGVIIKRDVFLRKELIKYCSEEEVQAAKNSFIIWRKRARGRQH